MFYDCTTLYFEAFTPDELKQNGFSKDGKYNQPQVLLALLVTEEGLPIGYDVFPRATFEGNTIIPSLHKLQKTHNLSKLTVVADCGMMNKANVLELDKHNFSYVVGANIKKLRVSFAQKVISEFADLNSREEQEIREFAYPKQDSHQRLIVSYSSKRACKDAYEREKRISKLTAKLARSKNPTSLLTRHSPFVQIKGCSEVVLNESNITKNSQFDGLKGIVTNIPDEEAQTIIGHYRQLWRVEQSFHITKHDLKIRPIFHWTPRRVRAHIAICFMAYACVRFTEYQVALRSIRKLSPENIRSALSAAQHTIIKHNNSHTRYLIPSKISLDAHYIYKAMDLHISDVPHLLA